ncbi:MAG: peptide chain release factor 2 [Candidatus Berkelbacteria bacterium]|nr:MAG: peptide chain release factor 2 [Candidatus Berkelbacteria bacterium]QQG51444.1 MAG: peptide chain release factor 2 [Candidatus Berkelbacteria bacterium]
MATDDRKKELDAILDISSKRERMAAIQQEMADPKFWEDHERAAKTAQELKHLDDIILRFDLAETEAELEELEDEATYTGAHDNSSAFLSVHAGSGGTEAQDWAEMLLRMYMRYAEKADCKVQLLDRVEGEEAGIKNATLFIQCFRAYGRLKGENGTHRLVRISPFDSDKARHTSFALVEVVPEIERSELAIKPDELKIDVYRAGGHGGQGVNTTDSAVRLTHLPTGIVVTCQNERSQLQNKNQALKILQGKLQLLDDEKHRAEEQKHRGEPVLASWGNQIRSYVLQPYQLVKDLRSGYETSAVQDILDGEIEPFLEAYRKHVAQGKINYR